MVIKNSTLDRFIQYLNPGTDLGTGYYTSIKQYLDWMYQYLDKLVRYGEIDWQRMEEKLNYMTVLRRFIVTNFPIGHDLIYLMNSGDQWLENVEKYMKENNIKMPS